MRKKSPAKPVPPRKFPDAALFALIGLSTLLAYLPALTGTLLWDDSGHVTRPDLQSWHGLWRIWFDVGATQQYYPLLHSAFWIEHRLWGESVLGYHLINVLLHAVSACLLVVIVRRLSLSGAWLAGLIFALHPVCVEAVAWISEQKSTLSGVFYLAAALVYLGYDRERRRRQYLLALSLFVLALLSKSVTATLPAALLVVFWWQRGRLGWQRDVRPLLPWFGLSVAAGIGTAWVERKYIGAEGADFALTAVERCLLAGRAIWFYLGKLVWPANLIFTYPRWKFDPAAWWLYLFPAGAVALAVALYLIARKHRGPLAAFLIFAGTLFPVLGFFNVYPFRFSYVADHFQYLALLAPIVLVAHALSVPRRDSSRRLLLPAILSVLLLLAAQTYRQSATYRDAETLYRATLARNPDSWMARNNLGFILSRQPGQLDDAIAQYRQALRIEPDYAGAHINLGNAYYQTMRYPEAIAEYQAALRSAPANPNAHSDLGNALAEMPGRLPEAIVELQTAVRLKPDFAEAHNNLGLALARAGRLSEAITEYQAALRLRPDDAAAHYNLATALAKIPGRRPDAIAEYEAALRIRPDLQAARQKLDQLRAATPATN